MVVEPLEEVITLVFEPDRVLVLDIDVQVLFLLLIVLTFRVGRLLKLTLSCGQVSKLFLRELRFDRLLLTHSGHLRRSFFLFLDCR